MRPVHLLSPCPSKLFNDIRAIDNYQEVVEHIFVKHRTSGTKISLTVKELAVLSDLALRGNHDMSIYEGKEFDRHSWGKEKSSLIEGALVSSGLVIRVNTAESKPVYSLSDAAKRSLYGAVL